MAETMPVGEVVRLMDRGVITLPSKYRKKLKIKKGELLNVFPWQGLLIVTPVGLAAKTKAGNESEVADWIIDTPTKYLKKVRYNSLEKLWAKRLRERW